MILLVDDDKIIIKIVTQMLEQMGKTVISATNYEDAIELYVDNVDEIEFIISDIYLGNMYGTSLFKTLWSFKPETKGILVTSKPDTNVAELGLEEGITILPKPFTAEQLKEIIQENS